MLLKFVRSWTKCTKCEIGCRTTTRPMYRGMPFNQRNPLDILFVGEAPGEKEDIVGEPFVGPSGVIFNMLVQDSRNKVRWRYRWGVINAVLCTPFTDSKCKSIRAPSTEEMQNCAPRVRDIVRKAQPKHIIAMGNVANKSLRDLVDLPSTMTVTHIKHPSWILRKGGYNTVAFKSTLHTLCVALKHAKQLR